MKLQRSDIVRFITFNKGPYYIYDCYLERIISLPKEDEANYTEAINREIEPGYTVHNALVEEGRTSPLYGSSTWDVENILNDYVKESVSPSLTEAYKKGGIGQVKEYLKTNVKECTKWCKYYTSKKSNLLDSAMELCGLEYPDADNESYISLVERIMTFWQLKPWEYFSDQDVIHIKYTDGLDYYIDILGQAGNTYGIVFYKGKSSLEVLKNIAYQSESNNSSGIVMASQQCISVYFDKPEEADPQSKAFAKEKGFSCLTEGKTSLSFTKVNNGLFILDRLSIRDIYKLVNLMDILNASLNDILKNPTEIPCSVSNTFLSIECSKKSNVLKVRIVKDLLKGKLSSLVDFHKEFQPMKPCKVNPKQVCLMDIRYIQMMAEKGDKNIRKAAGVICFIDKGSGLIIYSKFMDLSSFYPYRQAGIEIGEYFMKNGLPFGFVTPSYIGADFLDALLFNNSSKSKIKISKDIPELDEFFQTLNKHMDNF